MLKKNITRGRRKKIHSKKKVEFGAREMTPWVGTLATPAEDRGLIPSTHMTIDRHGKLQFQVTRPPLLTSQGTALTRCSYLRASKTLIHRKHKIKSSIKTQK